jgi:hypothetical protein
LDQQARRAADHLGEVPRMMSTNHDHGALGRDAEADPLEGELE